MPESMVIRVHEYERLRVGDRGFEQEHWHALGRWAERQKTKYLELWPGAVRFLNWVGVIEVDGLAIEILPKVADPSLQGARTVDHGHWRRILIGLLCVAGRLELRASDEASLATQERTLLDILFTQFLDEVEALLREGLVKRYRPVSGRRTALRGRVDLAATLRNGQAHKERFSCVAFEYDRVNNVNLILRDAVEASALFAPSDYSRGRARNASLEFVDWPPACIASKDFDSLRFDRKTQRYRRAITLARLILEKENPDLSSGGSKVFSILFDMNELWETAILARLRREARARPGMKVYGQRSKVFWRSGTGQAKTIRPDIVVETPDGHRRIIDTKWKIPTGGVPADQDLRQIYVYNLFWEARDGYLVYPSADDTWISEGRYASLPGHPCRGCGVVATSYDPETWKLETLLDQLL